MARTSQGVLSRSESPGFAVGLTGGIGSGKTAVADLFALHGAAVVDSDVIARALTAPGGAAIDQIARSFGADFIAADGSLDRQRMRDRVFRDPPAKNLLESILHPLIGELAMMQAAEARSHAPYVMFVVPLLIESGNWRSRVDRLLVVDCSSATQQARVCARSQLDVPLVQRIISQQARRADRLDAADDVLVNEGPLDQLLPRVQWLHRRYCGHVRQ